MNKKQILAVVGFILTTAIFAGTYSQAPMLDDLVNKGQLPSVEKRLPEKPLVIKTVDNVGKYGGTLYVAAKSLKQNGYGDDLHIIGFETPIQLNPDDTTGPNVIEKWEYSKDYKKLTLHIRKGIKWSDGIPFTADDILYWWNDELHNQNLVPVNPYKQFQKTKMKKIDEFTVEMDFDVSYPLFNTMLSKEWGFWGKWWRPKHYLKQFNPNYTDKAKLKKKAEEQGFSNIKDYYMYYAGWGIKPKNTKCPTLTAYMLKESKPNYRLYVRNPYYFKTDQAGNQLPYIDKVLVKKVSDNESIQNMIISGQVDFAAWCTDIANYPMYKKNEAAGHYNTYLWKTDNASEVRYMLNQTTQDKDLNKLFNNIKFRKALSLAINRKEINDTLYFGKATARAYYLLPGSSCYENKWENYYTEYNPARANKLLDEIGLTKKDSDGFRLDKNGYRISFSIEYWDEEPAQKTPMTELIQSYWKAIGLNIGAKNISRDLLFERGNGNKIECTNWQGGGMMDSQWMFYLQPPIPDRRLSYGMLWGRWYVTDGKEGKKPPKDLITIIDCMKKIGSEPDKVKRTELGKKAWNLYMKNLYVIGTVGLAPYPLIVSKKLHNVPKSGIWASDMTWLHPYHPEQFYLDK